MILPVLLASVFATSAGSVPAQQPGVIELERIGSPALLEGRLRALLRSGGAPAGITVANGQVHSGNFALPAGQRSQGHLLVLQGDADLAGAVGGNLVVLDGNLILRAGAQLAGDALVIGGRVIDEGGTVAGELRSVSGSRAGAEPTGTSPAGMRTRFAGLAGVFTVLLLAGFAMVTFARERLEIVSDTVARSFFRSFAIGVLAQVVALPTAGLLVLGLVLSIVGILLLPFVAVVVPLIALAAVLAGFLGALHAMGETRVRKRMAAGELAGSPNSYRFLMIGLTGVGLLWLTWAGFGGIPVAGGLVLLVALVTTWVVASAGLGAFLLSRGGLRADPGGRLLPPEALTDEYLWATPRYGVAAARRPPPHP